MVRLTLLLGTGALLASCATGPLPRARLVDAKSDVKAAEVLGAARDPEAAVYLELARDQVVFGATVVVKDLEFDDEEIFVLVGAGEEDYDAGKILVTSPLAQGLLGKKQGDRVEIEVPKGTMRFEILEIRFEV